MKNLWQNAIWQTFQELLGRKTRRLEVSGASALVVQHRLPAGMTYMEIPRGPIFENETALAEIIKEARDLAKREGAIFLRMSPYKELKCVDCKLQIAEGDHHPETTLVLDLLLSEEELLAQMKPKGRYNIKVAQKHGVTVETGNDIHDFYELLQKTGGRDGFGINPESHYKKMLEALGDHAQLLLARHEGKVIAGGIFVYLDDTATYYYGASDHSSRKLMAPYLVQWEAVREAKKRGCKTYDFLGISPENNLRHAWAGVTEFKKKFGGNVVNYPKAKDMVVRPFLYFLYRLYKNLRKH